VLAWVGEPPPGAPVLDEHVAGDADACPEPFADVLYGRRPRPAVEAARRVDELLALHPGCRVVAVPVVAGGWAVGHLRVRARLTPPGPCGVSTALFASCLHAWLVAGRSLDELSPPSAVLLHG
jgi:hypothetical protein